MKTNKVVYAPWEKALGKILTPFEEFVHRESSSGLLLMACTVVALVLANSTLAPLYADVLHLPIAVNVGSLLYEHSLHHWINDGLMGLFFMLVGLEIKREVLVGELSSPRQAVIPIIAAIGGMVVPALVYWLFNLTGDGQHGWGIPMATDIAFAIGVLVLLGKRIPTNLLVFLTALAIVDDLGAVLVIAIFYTEQINGQALLAAGGIFGVMMIMNLSGFRKPLPYFVVGAFLWVAMFESGIHATIAGVLAALAIPCRPKFDLDSFIACMNNLTGYLDKAGHAGKTVVHDSRQRGILQSMENNVLYVQTPLQRLEHSMHIPVAFGILPLFALANAGIPINVETLDLMLMQPVTLGVIAGLVLGKPLGIAGATWLAVRQGWGTLPPGMTMAHVIGAGFVGGIGFTMSIFIAELGFKGQVDMLLMAKTGILFASLLAGIIGCLWLLMVTKNDG